MTTFEDIDESNYVECARPPTCPLTARTNLRACARALSRSV
eukprot:COSAG06_NODE_1327_length_9855_cov_3.900574_2_plen_41_part_00